MSEAPRARPPGPDEGGRTLHLHVGLPKTASTWLQSQVFPALTHLHVATTPRSRLFDDPEDREAEGRVMGCALRRAPLVWAAMGDAVIEGLVGRRDAWLSHGRDLLISEEAIGRAGSRPQDLAAHLREIRAAAGRWGFERIQILCLIRRQDHWLASHYAQMSDRAPRASQRDFEAFVRRICDPAGGRYLLGMLLDYAVLREALLGCGADLVLMPHEALLRTPAEALRRLLMALGTPEADLAQIEAASLGTVANVRSVEGSWRLRPRSLRLAGHRRAALPAWAPLGGRGAIALTPEIAARVAEAYAPSNRALEAALPMGLAALGYPGLEADRSGAHGLRGAQA